MKEMQETFEVEDIRVIEALNSPMRLRILYRMGDPTTVRDLAEGLGVPVTRLYYHVNLLEDLGVLEVVDTRKSGALLQKVYRATAKNYKPGPGLLADIDDKQRFAEIAVATVLDGARLDAEAGLIRHFAQLEQGEEKAPGALGRTIIKLTPEGARAFAEKLEGFLSDARELEVEDGEEYALSVVFFPQTGPFGDPS